MKSDTTRRYYETHAKDYFLLTRDRGIPAYWRMIEGYALPGARILDLGCGSGRDMKHFAGEGYRVVGIDYSLPLLKLAADYSKQEVILSDLRALPFAAGSFDAAWAMASLLHLKRYEAQITLSQIRACLKPSAPFFSAVKRGSGEEVDSLGRYNAYYTLCNWSDALDRSGFQVVAIDETSECREAAGGSWEVIPWIATVALAK